MKTNYEIENLEWVVINVEEQYAVASFLIKEDAEYYIETFANNKYQIKKI